MASKSEKQMAASLAARLSEAALANYKRQSDNFALALSLPFPAGIS